ncbi:MAG: hypothetical protein OEV28_01410 [Nitrospirota bacterium]|nr:hypothetical protein [Nitrospirota bacterium]
MLDFIITVGGILYGVTLIAATFIHNAFTNAIRIDALFIPNPSAATRPLNLVIGLLLVGYLAYPYF